MKFSRLLKIEEIPDSFLRFPNFRGRWSIHVLSKSIPYIIDPRTSPMFAFKQEKEFKSIDACFWPHPHGERAYFLKPTGFSRMATFRKIRGMKFSRVTKNLTKHFADLPKKTRNPQTFIPAKMYAFKVKDKKNHGNS